MAKDVLNQFLEDNEEKIKAGVAMIGKLMRPVMEKAAEQLREGIKRQHNDLVMQQAADVRKRLQDEINAAPLGQYPIRCADGAMVLVIAKWKVKKNRKSGERLADRLAGFEKQYEKPIWMYVKKDEVKSSGTPGPQSCESRRTCYVELNRYTSPGVPREHNTLLEVLGRHHEVRSAIFGIESDWDKAKPGDDRTVTYEVWLTNKNTFSIVPQGEGVPLDGLRVVKEIAATSLEDAAQKWKEIRKDWEKTAAANDPPSVAIGQDGLCRCNAADKCALGLATGSQIRCQEEALKAAGVNTYTYREAVRPMADADGRVWLDVVPKVKSSRPTRKAFAPEEVRSISNTSTCATLSTCRIWLKKGTFVNVIGDRADVCKKLGLDPDDVKP